MSAISTKIYGNDMAMDVKADFQALYGIEKSLQEITDYILGYAPNDDDEDACAFWTALACVEWEYGVLQEEIKQKAQYFIKNKSDALLFFSDKDKKLREEELNALYEKLDSPNLKPKKKKYTFVFRSPWTQGDVLALSLGDKYAYLHIVGIKVFKHKIKELEEDQIYVKVFDVFTDDLLSIKDFRRPFKKIKYRDLAELKNEKNVFVEELWCVGKREQKTLEEKIKVVGNIPAKAEYSNRVSSSYQFNKLETTLRNLFEKN